MTYRDVGSTGAVADSAKKSLLGEAKQQPLHALFHVPSIHKRNNIDESMRERESHERHTA